jgi:CIC family chloride channel protein
MRRLARGVEDMQLHTVGRTLALCGMIGLVAGGGAIAFQVLCSAAMRFFLDAMAGLRQAGPAGESLLFAAGSGPLRAWMLPIVCGLGGLLTGAIVEKFAPEAAGHGTDAAIEAFHYKHGAIRGVVPFVKTIASAFTMGSGGSGGREGPIAQIGAGFGSFLARWLRLPERERRILLAAGVGAGVGSIFRAPLAGALFAAEVLYSDPEFESDVIIPAAIATIVAYCVFSLKFGFGSLFATPRLTFNSAFELIPYTGLALLSALAAGVFVRTFYASHDFFKKLRIRPTLKPMLGGIATGTIGMLLYYYCRDQRSLDVLSFGYGSVQHALRGELPIALLLMIAGGKILTTSLSIGSGGSGGVFGPSMVIGGALGGAVGLIAQHFMPDVVTQPAAFVPVGMAGFFAAAANTPISTLVMVSEMTGNYQLLLPALWVCSLAYLLGRRWNLYRSQVASRSESPVHRGAILGGVLRDFKVREVVGQRPIHCLKESDTLDEVLQAFTRSSQHCFPVVDGQQHMTGLISIDQIRKFLDEQPEGLPVIAHDLASPPGLTLSLEDDLDTALDRFLALDVEELPVIDSRDRLRVVGLLSRRDIIAVYNRHRLSAARSQPVPE